MQRLSRRAALVGGDGQGMRLLYSIREETCPACVTDGLSGKSYGVEILLLPSCRRRTFSSVTADLKSAVQLLDILAAGKVTPIGAKDVIYDWLCVRSEL